MRTIPTDLKPIVEHYEHVKITKGIHKTITHKYTVSCGTYYYLLPKELYEELMRKPIGGIKFQYPNGTIKTYCPYRFCTEEEAYHYLWKWRYWERVAEEYLWSLGISSDDTFLSVCYIKDIHYAKDNYIERCHNRESVYFVEEDKDHNFKVYNYINNGNVIFLGEIKCLGCLYLDKPLDFSKWAIDKTENVTTPSNINDNLNIDLAILKHTLTRLATPKLVKALSDVYNEFRKEQND